MRRSFKGLYVREMIKVSFLTVIVLALLVGILWTCLFITDYIMVRNSKPTVFTNSHIEETENGKVVYEDGVFYHIVTDENQTRTLYLFNKEINIK